MNCANCGATLELAESGRHLRCGHCGSLRFAEPIETDGIRVLGRTGDDPACPVCSVPMDAALLDGVHSIHFCGRCRGALMSRTTFAGTISSRRAWAMGPPSDPIPLDRRALERKLACPSCRGPFETFPHYGPGNVVIDTCAACDQIWLDYGEMRQIVEAPGRDRGSRQVTPTDDTYVRKGLPGSREESDDRDPVKSLFEILFDS